MFNQYCFFVVVLLAAAPLCAQQDVGAAPLTDTNPADDARMLVPPPVNGGAYAAEGSSQARANYMRAGLTFNSAYSDNVLGGVSANPISDISYSVWPFVALDETTPRMHSLISYDPGFTFYQRTANRNEADQSLTADFSYRLTPHVTLGLYDSFHKSSSFLTQPDSFASNPVSGSAQASSVTVLAPLADQLNNTARANLTYQFARNAMVGITGAFTNLHYPDPTQVPGLYDSSSKSASAFYNHRLSRMHYIGITYQFQDLLAFPTGLQAETQTHSALLYYTLYARPTLSFSFFGGPEYSNTALGFLPGLHSWTPVVGASLGWQGRQTAFALSYSRMIAPGDGLTGAVHQNGINASLQRQLTPKWSAGIGSSYTINRVLEPLLFSGLQGSLGGHTIAGTASLHRDIGEHVSFGLRYSRLHQSYANIAAITRAPDTNVESVSISYHFTRPLGR